MKVATPLSLALLLSVQAAAGQTTGTTNAQSNIALTQYPAPDCAPPSPVDPATKLAAPDPANRTQTATEIFLYNSKVRAYNTTIHAHNDGVKNYGHCIESYVAAGNADIQRIQSAIGAAVAAANGRDPAPVPAQTGSVSNIALTQYPAPKCALPPAVDPAMKPEPPSTTLGVEEAARYNSKVRAYSAALQAQNDGMKAHAECVQGYIAAGKADIQRIQAAIDVTVAIANGQ